MRECKVKILAPAWRELDEIAELHLALVGSASAQRITDGILDDLALLKTNPFLGRACDEPLLAADQYRKLIIKDYLCFYKVIGGTVFIYHIIHGRRNYPLLFAQEK